MRGVGLRESCRSEELEPPLYLGPWTLRIYPQVGSSTGAVRVRAWSMGAFLCARKPEAVGKVTGTGCASPAFTKESPERRAAYRHSSNRRAVPAPRRRLGRNDDLRLARSS